MSLFVKESYVNVTEGYRYGDDANAYESFADKPGELFRFMRREYGRCTGKVYVDLPGEPAKHVGWVFQARAHYEDQPSKTYLREVWVTVVTGPDTVTRTEHYADLES